MFLAGRVFAETLERARAQATYEGQLKEARQRLEREASERESLAMEKSRLEDQLKNASKSNAEAALAAQERRNQAQETAMLLKQQEAEVSALREEIAALKSAVRSEEDSRKAAERKAEEAQVQLSVERAGHLKVQKSLQLEKTQHEAVKEKLMALLASQGDGGAELLATMQAAAAAAPQSTGGGDGGVALAAAQASIVQLKNKLSHVEGDREREKHKLQKTVDAANIRRKEWDREKQQLKRQLENHEAEVRKRDKWLDKAKDIIKEYQKRHTAPPGASPGPGR